MSKSVKVSFDAAEIANKLTHIDKKFRENVKSDVKEIKKETKSIVKKKLEKNHGVEYGVYKKSIVIHNLENSGDRIGYQVGSKKHYRLTHLLENGHEIWVFIRGKGRPTYRGNVGMNKLNRKTKKIPHIQYGQEYADKAIVEMYENAWEKALGKEN